MTPEEAACKIDHLYQPHGVVLDEDIIDILNQVAATAGNARLIEVAEMWEGRLAELRLLTCTGHAEAGRHEWGTKELRAIAATPQGEKT